MDNCGVRKAQARGSKPTVAPAPKQAVPPGSRHFPNHAVNLGERGPSNPRSLGVKDLAILFEWFGCWTTTIIVVHVRVWVAHAPRAKGQPARHRGRGRDVRALLVSRKDPLHPAVVLLQHSVVAVPAQTYQAGCTHDVSATFVLCLAPAHLHCTLLSRVQCAVCHADAHTLPTSCYARTTSPGSRRLWPASPSTAACCSRRPRLARLLPLPPHPRRRPRLATERSATVCIQHTVPSAPPWRRRHEPFCCRRRARALLRTLPSTSRCSCW